MNTKVCLNCGTTFEAKRSDASYCSKQCKSKVAYKKNKRINNNMTNLAQSSENATQKIEDNIKLSGEINVQKIIGLIDKIGNKSENIDSTIKQLEFENSEKLSQIIELENNIIIIKQSKQLEISKRLNLSDFMLYNNFLNKEYLAKKKEGYEFASNRLLPEEDIMKSYNTKLRLSIVNYRYKLEYQLQTVNYDIEVIENKITLKKTILEQNSAKIKEQQKDLRFNQSRILKYESLLSV